MLDDRLKKSLIEAASRVLPNAYSPYSGVKVSAAVLDELGRIFSGVNVENASLGLTVCAERNAVASAVVAGAKSITAVLIASNIGPLTPCGACRQVIAEFASPETPVFIAFEGEIVEQYTIGELLPEVFKLGLE